MFFFCIEKLSKKLKVEQKVDIYLHNSMSFENDFGGRYLIASLS